MRFSILQPWGLCKLPVWMSDEVTQLNDTLVLLWYSCNTCLFRKLAFSPLSMLIVSVQSGTACTALCTSFAKKLWDEALYFKQDHLYLRCGMYMELACIILIFSTAF